MTSPTVSPITEWQHIDDDECRIVSNVMEIVGRRWSAAILLALARGAERFTEIEALVLGLSSRMLAVRLRELEDGGLVERVVIPTTPVSVRYHLSPRGVDLMAALQPISGYAQRWEGA